jgi:hypothetical protein
VHHLSIRPDERDEAPDILGFVGFSTLSISFC